MNVSMAGFCGAWRLPRLTAAAGICGADASLRARCPLLQVFVALLRACQPDGRRTLVRQALDVLTPALVKRLPMTPEHKYPIWIRYTKRVGGLRP